MLATKHKISVWTAKSQWQAGNKNPHNVSLTFLLLFDFLAFSDMKKKSWTNLVCTNCMYFLFWGKMRRLCFSGGVTVFLLVDKGSLTFLMLFLHPAHVHFLLSHTQRVPPFCVLTIIMSLCQMHQEANSLWFMYLIKAVLSNFNFSEATAFAFYIRQLFHRLWIGLMESVLLPFPWKDGGRREGEWKGEEERVRCWGWQMGRLQF